jgi:hypothetical protein
MNLTGVMGLQFEDWYRRSIVPGRQGPPRETSDTVFGVEGLAKVAAPVPDQVDAADGGDH